MLIRPADYPVHNIIHKPEPISQYDIKHELFYIILPIFPEIHSTVKLQYLTFPVPKLTI